MRIMTIEYHNHIFCAIANTKHRRLYKTNIKDNMHDLFYDD